jgi:hypothetical protein
MMTNFNQRIIPLDCPISAKGGRRHRSIKNKLRTRKIKRSNKSRTRRRYH